MWCSASLPLLPSPLVRSDAALGANLGGVLTRARPTGVAMALIRRRRLSEQHGAHFEMSSLSEPYGIVLDEPLEPYAGVDSGYPAPLYLSACCCRVSGLSSLRSPCTEAVAAWQSPISGRSPAPGVAPAIRANRVSALCPWPSRADGSTNRRRYESYRAAFIASLANMAPSCIPAGWRPPAALRVGAFADTAASASSNAHCTAYPNVVAA